MKYSILLAGSVNLALLASATGAMAGGNGYGDRMWGGGFGMMAGGGAVMLLFWIAIIVLVVLAVRWLSENRGKGGQASPLGILQERLARGEIDPDEYQTRKSALEQ